MKKVGISFPFRSDGKGSIKSSTDLISSIEDSIKQIIFTKKGERRMNPEFGCDLWKIIFEYDEYIIQEMVKEYVIDSINRWETRIEILDILVKKYEEFIDIGITYSIKYSNMPIKDINIQYFRN